MRNWPGCNVIGTTCRASGLELRRRPTTAIWRDWLQGATTLVDALADSSHNLGVAAVAYSERDADSAAVFRLDRD